MCVEIAEQQRELKKQQADGPDRGDASEPGKDEFGDDGFDLKKKECAKKNRETECPFDAIARRR
jgi:hypothetical protein